MYQSQPIMTDKPVKNTGLVIEDPQDKDYRAGEVFGVVGEDFVGQISPLESPEIIFPNGKGWLDVALRYGISEKQFNKQFDTYSCVVYSIAKGMCYFLYKKHGLKTTISEMYNAFYAHVRPGVGTTIRRGMESFRKHGWLDDRQYKYTAEMTAKEFFSEPPKSIQIIAEGKLTQWDFHWEVLPNNLKGIVEAYKKTPVVLTGYAWASDKNRVYYDNGKYANHAFLGLELKDNGNNFIDDTYPQDRNDPYLGKEDMLKELHSSFDYASAHRVWLTRAEKANKLSIKYIINMLKKIARDVHGGFWFIKDNKKQKISSWKAMLGALIDEIGVEKNNLSDVDLANIPNKTFFK